MSNINDYPEHLNPFYEDDNHNRIRFWNKTKKLVRSNSFSLSGFNDGFKGIRNSIRRSVSRSRRNSTTTSKESSPVLLRRQQPQDNSSLTPEYGPTTERIKNEHGFVIPYHEQKFPHNNSITPTPRSKFNSTSGDEYFSLPIRSSRYRFQPDASSTPRKATSVCDHRTSQQPFALPGLASATHSRKTSISSLNPFEDDDVHDFDGSKLSPASRRVSKNGTFNRKKRRAPLPPTLSVNQSLNDSGIQVLDVTDPVFNTSLEITENDLELSSKITSENTLSKSNVEQIETVVNQIEKLNSDTETVEEQPIEKTQEDINGNKEIIQVEENISEENSVEINENEQLNSVEIKILVEKSPKEETYNNQEENQVEINGNEQLNSTEPEVQESRQETLNENLQKNDSVTEKLEIIIVENHTEKSINNDLANENNETIDKIDNSPEKVDENNLEKTDNSTETHLDQQNSTNHLTQNGLTKIESEVVNYIDDSTVISTPKCPVKIIISTHDDPTLGEPKLSVKDIVRNLDEKSRLENMKEKLFIDEKHLAKEEIFEDTESNNNFENVNNSPPTPIPRMKKISTVNGDHIDPTKPNQIPKPKRSKLYAKLTKWTHKN